MSEPVVEASAQGPELVYSGTYSKEPEEQTPVKSTVRDGYFKEDKVSIRHQYVGSANFPAFTNDLLSEQERAALEQAYIKELTQQQQDLANPEEVKKATTQRAPARLSEPAVDSEQEDILWQAQQQRGLQARQHKPNRVMIQPISQPVVVSAEKTLVSQPQASEQPTTAPVVAAASPEEDEDLLSAELGLDDESISTPIPASVSQK